MSVVSSVKQSEPIKEDTESESEDSEESEESSEEEDSSEDERDRRRQQKQKPVLGSMEPIDPSEAAENKTEFSSDDAEEESFISKLGSMLFFGCGNAKDKQEKPNTLQ